MTEGMPPGMRFRLGPAGTCGTWASHHWIVDRWQQTICAACNAKIEPIPGAYSPQDFIPGYRVRFIELDNAYLIGQGWAGGIPFDEAVMALAREEDP